MKTSDKLKRLDRLLRGSACRWCAGTGRRATVAEWCDAICAMRKVQQDCEWCAGTGLMLPEDVWHAVAPHPKSGVRQVGRPH